MSQRVNFFATMANQTAAASTGTSATSAATSGTDSPRSAAKSHVSGADGAVASSAAENSTNAPTLNISKIKKTKKPSSTSSARPVVAPQTDNSAPSSKRASLTSTASLPTLDQTTPNATSRACTSSRIEGNSTGSASSRHSSVASTLFDARSAADSPSEPRSAAIFFRPAARVPSPSKTTHRTGDSAEDHQAPPSSRRTSTASRTLQQVDKTPSRQSGADAANMKVVPPSHSSSAQHPRRASTTSKASFLDPPTRSATTTDILRRSTNDLNDQQEERTSPVEAQSRHRSRSHTQAQSESLGGGMEWELAEEDEGHRVSKRAKVEREEVVLVPGSDSYSQDHLEDEGLINSPTPAPRRGHILDEDLHPPPPSSIPQTSQEEERHRARAQQQQHAGGETMMTLMEEVNGELEVYFERQQQKADLLREKWSSCTIEEWHEGGKEIAARFSALITFVCDGMNSKKRKFDDINTRIEDHSKTLENREKQLKIEKDILVNETGRVVETKGR